jgi:hypothetical protein
MSTLKVTGARVEHRVVCATLFFIVLPQLDTIISQILTYSQDFKSLERIIGD